MQTSARNHFAGTVSHIRPGAINDEIELAIADGVRIVATVTRESTQSLGLVIGAAAFALVKASSIILVTEDADVRLSARNQLGGVVSRLTPGAINTEVVMTVGGAIDVVAVITNESAKHLKLAVGAKAVAIFKAGSVVLGVRA